MNDGISTRPAAATAAMAKPRFESGQILIPTPFTGGNLIFDPGQKFLNDDQLVLLAPLGIDKRFSPPYVMAFLAECHARGLDPWSREAYLMLYPGDKYIRHIGIAGFLRIAEETGKFKGIEQAVYYDDEMKPYKVWPFRDRAPYAAEVTAHRVDRIPATVVALYDEYAPLEEDRVWDAVKKSKVPTGKGKVPTPMWRTAVQGGKPSVMLAKCARAASLRLLFPQTFGGFYEPAEFDRAAQDIADLGADETATRRREAYAAAHGGQTVDAGDVGAEVITVTTPAAAQPVDQADAPETPDADEPGPTDDETPPTMTGDVLKDLLLAELDEQARILGRDRAWMTKRWSEARDGQKIEDATLATIQGHVQRFRPYVIGKLREKGRDTVADKYSIAPPVGTVAELFGDDYPWAEPPARERAINGLCVTIEEVPAA